MNANEKLINAVLEQIQTDIIREDLTAIAEMLERLPEATLINYLSDIEYENLKIDLDKLTGGQNVQD